MMAIGVTVIFILSIPSLVFFWLSVFCKLYAVALTCSKQINKHKTKFNNNNHLHRSRMQIVDKNLNISEAYSQF